MPRWSTWRQAPLKVLAAILVLAACADRTPTDPPSKSPGPQDAAAPVAALTALVEQMRLADPRAFSDLENPITVRVLGRGRTTLGPPPDDSELERREPEPGEERPSALCTPDTQPPDPCDADRQTLIAFNPATGFELEVTLSADLLRTFHLLAEARHLTLGSEDVPDPRAVERIGADEPGVPNSLSTHGWSNGVDGRVLLTPTSTYPWRTISQFTYGTNDSRCSGTLVGPRHVVTAAHCIFNRNTMQWLTPSVRPGRDGINSAPFGISSGVIWFFTPSRFRDANETNFRQWDWGVIVLANSLGNLAGWMGYVARPFAELQAVFQSNRGYPSCVFVEAPANCQTARLYGDLQDCGLGGGSSKNPDGWYRLLSVNCDLSRGHSGSPIYHYFVDPVIQQTVAVVAGVVVAHTCTTCTPSDNFPNWIRRLTPGTLGTISWLRQTFP